MYPPVEASGGQEWYEVGSQWSDLMFYCLQFSTVLCNRLSSFFHIYTPNAPQCPYTPVAPLTPHFQYRHLVVKSGTTAGQHDMSSTCGSGWCFVRCTPSLTPQPHMSPQCPPGRAIWWPRSTNFSPVDLNSCSIVPIDHLEFWLCNSPSLYFKCNPSIPQPPEPLHPCQTHDAPLTPYTPCQPPDAPYTPAILLMPPDTPYNLPKYSP